MPAKLVYSGNDFKIPAWLASSSIVYYLYHPIDLQLFKLIGEPPVQIILEIHSQKLHYCSSRQGRPLDRRNGLKTSASATSVVHPSVPLLSGPVWTFPRHLGILAYSIIQTEFLIIRHDAHCQSEQQIHPFPGETLKCKHDPFTFSFFLSVHHNQELWTNFINYQPKWLFFIYFESSTFWFSRVSLDLSNKPYVYCFSRYRAITDLADTPSGHSSIQPHFWYEFHITRWVSAVSDGLCEPWFFLLHSRHAAQYVWLTPCTHWPQNHSCSHPFLPCSISTNMNQTAQETQAHCRSCLSIAVSKTWKPCRRIFVIFSSKVKCAWLVISLILYFNSSLRTNHHSAHIFK